jgi:hypothetical protein
MKGKNLKDGENFIMQKSSLEIISIWMVREITFLLLFLLSCCSHSHICVYMTMILLETESDENFTPIYLKDT